MRKVQLEEISEDIPKHFLEFWGSKGFEIEEVNSTEPPEHLRGIDFISCNAMRFGDRYVNPVEGEQAKYVRLQRSLRQDGELKSGTTDKHLTCFDMIGIFDLECEDPSALTTEIIRYFAEELGIGYENLSVNIASEIFERAINPLEQKGVKKRTLSEEELKWKAKGIGLDGTRCEINWIRPDGTEWELWNISYIDGRIFDSGGSLERTQSAFEKADSVFEVGELGELKSEIGNTYDGLVESEIRFLCDQIRTAKRLIEEGICPGGKLGREVFLRKTIENIFRTLYSAGLEMQSARITELLRKFGSALIEKELELFTNKIQQAKLFISRNGEVFPRNDRGEIDLEKTLSPGFKSKWGQKLNLLKSPSALVRCLLENGETVNLDENLSKKLEQSGKKIPRVEFVRLMILRIDSVINKVRSAIQNIDPEAGILIVGSYSNGVLDPGDVDLVVLSGIQGLKTEMRRSLSGFQDTIDDSERYVIDDKEVGIVALSLEEFSGRIEAVLSGKNLDMRYKLWAIGAEVPEGFLGDLERSKTIKDHGTGLVTHYRKRMDPFPEELRGNLMEHICLDIKSRIEQLETAIKRGNKMSKELTISIIKFLLVRFMYAKRREYFRGAKSVENLDKRVEDIVELLNAVNQENLEQTKALIKEYINEQN